MKARGTFRAFALFISVLAATVASSLLAVDNLFLPAGAGVGLFSGGKSKKTILSGRILDSESAQPVAAVIKFPEHDIEPLVSDPFTGEFEINLKPGVYRIRVESKGYKWKEKGVVVKEGDRKVLDFTLEKGGEVNAQVAGLVKDSDTDEVLGEVSVSFKGPEQTRDTETDVLGVFKAFVQPGDYVITFSKDGYCTREVNISVEASEFQQLDVVLWKDDVEVAVLPKEVPESEESAEPVDSSEIEVSPDPPVSEEPAYTFQPELAIVTEVTTETVPAVEPTQLEESAEADGTNEPLDEIEEPSGVIVTETSEVPNEADDEPIVEPAAEVAEAEGTEVEVSETEDSEVEVTELAPEDAPTEPLKPEETVPVAVTGEPVESTLLVEATDSGEDIGSTESLGTVESEVEAVSTTESLTPIEVISIPIMPEPETTYLSVDTTGTGALLVRIPPAGQRSGGTVYKTETSPVQTGRIDGIPDFGNILFIPGSAEIAEESTGVLEEVLRFLQSNPSISIEIAGHTDSVGDEETNLAISITRAQAVKTWLVERGIAESRLTAKGYGESRPRADNRTRSGQDANRRIEFSILTE